MKYSLNIKKINDKISNIDNIVFDLPSIGEGLVFIIDHPDYNRSSFKFKAKGEKHSSSKVKKVANVDIEKYESIKELVDCVLSENRLEQGIRVMVENNTPIEMSNIPTYLNWCKNDVFKEEMDTIVESGLEPKDLVSEICNRARKFYINYYNEN
jgi:hypothetical protein